MACRLRRYLLDQHVNGTLAVGASCLSGQVLDDPAEYRWLWNVQPTQILDHSTWMYEEHHNATSSATPGTAK